MQADDINNLIPVLDTEIEILDFNNSEYLVQHKTLEYQVNINAQTLGIINLVDGHRNLQQISKEFNDAHNSSINSSDVHQLLYNQLAKYGILKQNEFIVEKRKRATYLLMSFIFLRKKELEYITKLFTFLFHPRLFYVLFPVLFLFIMTVIIINSSQIFEASSEIFSLNMILYFIIFRMSGIFHEIGHASACRKFGAEHGGIGFGFYLFLPVLFADVSNIWKLKPKQRIIVNLGGIYFEMILATVLLCLYFINNNPALLIIPCLLIISTLYNLNPLIKYDGYWVLSDAIHIPNLHQRSYVKLRDFGKNIFNKDVKISLTGKDIFLIIYAFISLIFIFIILILMVVTDPIAIWKFPINSYEYIRNFENFKLGDFKELILPLIFWILILKIGVTFIINLFSKR
jgi:putative peptide zinc metalloprotease protein